MRPSNILGLHIPLPVKRRDLTLELVPGIVRRRDMRPWRPVFFLLWQVLCEDMATLIALLGEHLCYAPSTAFHHRVMCEFMGLAAVLSGTRSHFQDVICCWNHLFWVGKLPGGLPSLRGAFRGHKE